MLGDMKPFKMVGNLYFVGTYKASSHMIDTGDGLIVIDGGYEETADVIIESITDLGFNVKNIKHILISHGHGDHSHGVPKLKEISGAEVWIAQSDMRYTKNLKADHYFKDGDIVRLGNTEILCKATPGHTEGTISFFFNLEENGKIYRAGMFGGAGTNQLKKRYLDDKDNLRYTLREDYFKTLDLLRGEHVDIFIGNHAWNNKTKEKYELMQTSDTNPFIDDTEWNKFLDSCENNLKEVIETEIKTEFVNYAHRGASEYLPENTFISFNTGIFMGANGIETDVQLTKDGIPVLFHDDTLERVTGEEGSIGDFTFEELQNFFVKKDEFVDKIVKLEDFLKFFHFRDITFAIELKGPNSEKITADLIRKYQMEKKVVVTSFNYDYLCNIKEYAPDLRIGWLTNDVSDETVDKLKTLKADEFCPKGELLTKDNVCKWHMMGFRVRAWGIWNETIMKNAYDCGADGMTVNFPDKLTAYIKEKNV